MPQCVVDFLKVVQVQQQYRHLTTRTLGPLQFLCQTVQEKRTIRQICQCVVVGQALGGFFRAAAQGDVGAHAVVADEVPLGIEPRAAGNGVIGNGSARFLALDFKIAKYLVACQLRTVGVPHGVGHIYVGYFPPRQPFVEAAVGVGLCAVVPRLTRETEVLILLPVPVGGEVGQGFEPCIAFGQGQFGELPCCDVLPDAAVARKTPRLVEYRGSADGHPMGFACVGSAHFKVAKGLVCVQNSFVGRPVLFTQVQYGHVPAGQAQMGFGGNAGARLQLAIQGHKAEVLILLPVPVGGEVSQGPEALLACPQPLVSLSELLTHPRRDDADHQAKRHISGQLGFCQLQSRVHKWPDLPYQ